MHHHDEYKDLNFKYRVWHVANMLNYKRKNWKKKKRHETFALKGTFIIGK